MECRAFFIRLLACCLVAAFYLCWKPVQAQDNKVFSISPSSVQQGDTVLLTIEGKNLPTGTVVVEFFPQQIAVLNILSAEKDELIIQVKVPNMAPPGQYNILIYNHLGEEAFGEAVLNVGSDLITPIFEEYDPKTISEATDGFALMMTGSLITQDAVNQLKMDWYIGDELMKGLKTEFAMAGQRTVVCAITGELLGGTLRGRVLLNKTPIYMVQIELLLDRAMLIGVTPSLVDVSQSPYKFKLLGMGVSQVYVETLAAVLRSEAITAEAESIEFIDEASIFVTFPGPLPLGEYTIEVTAGGQPEYGGIITLEQGGEPVQPPESGGAGSEESGSGQAEPEAGTPETAGTPEGMADPESEPEAEEILPPQAAIVSLQDNRLEPGGNPVRLDLYCTDMQPEVFERLEAKLRVGLELAELTLVSTGDDKFTYVFTPDENGWLAGQTGTLEIIDPQGEVEAFRTIVAVDSLEPEAKDTGGEALVHSGGWDVVDARVSSSFNGQQLVVQIIPPDKDAKVDAVDCTYTVLPNDAGIEDLFSGLSLKGGLELSRRPDGSVAGTASGRFVGGDLIVKLTDETGASWLATLPLSAPGISAAVTVPAANSILVDPVVGTVEPAWLRWECRFSQLTPLDPETLSLRSSVELPGAEVLKVLLPDNGIALEIELSGLASELASYPEIEFWLDSTAELQWDKSSRKAITVQDASVAQTTGMLVAQENPVVLTPRGFEVKYKLSSGLEPAALAGKVEASSGMLLLDWNLSGFEIKTEIFSLPAGSILIVKFTRDPLKLDESAYTDLATKLAAAGLVGFKLHWPGSGVSNSSQLQFSQ